MDWYAEKRGSVLRGGLLTILVVLIVLAGVVVIKGVFTVSVPAQRGTLYIVNTKVVHGMHPTELWRAPRYTTEETALARHKEGMGRGGGAGRFAGAGRLGPRSSWPQAGWKPALLEPLSRREPAKQ